MILGYATNRAVVSVNNSENVDTRIDNQGYWTRLAAKGIVPYNPEVVTEPAIFTGSSIRATTVTTRDSPDIPVTEINCVQSENSIFINPLDETNILNSNNSATNPVDTTYGANSFFSFNSGTTWDGDIEGAGEDNFGDPAATIGLNGRWYINYMDHDFRMAVSYSDDYGETWVVKDASPNPALVCDKNHMWIDNNPDSPYEGNLYVAWSNFNDLDLGEIGLSYSVDDGETWILNTNISSNVEALSHNQGVNISTGPDGEVYAVWAIYDSWPAGGSDEAAMGMAKSLDGGATWEPAKRIISDIRGIRSSRTNKNMRVNSFPSATVDNSNGADRGTVFVTWANKGIPGINTGTSVDIYLIKSSDEGETWSDPIRVNQDPIGMGKQHFMPWITCDPTTGILSMIYYDDRNEIYGRCEVFCANSVDGGEFWEEFKVSDVSFSPAPIPGLADSYMGDYLGIHAKNGVVYPVWTDNRLGYAMSFCSPYETNPVNRPYNLKGEVEFITGQTELSWSYDHAPGFLNFIVYRDGDSIASATDTLYTDILPEYGTYRYRVTAYYNDDIESGATGISLQWGNPIINVQPDSIYDHLPVGSTSEHEVLVINNGQLPLEFSVTLNSSQSKRRGYCEASGGGGIGNEYISGVEVGDISNINTGSNNYTDYYSMSTIMKVGTSYNITVTNGQSFDLDHCGVWIDWNINEVFEENEILVLDGATGSSTLTGTIIPPPGAITGTTKMRVRLTYSGGLDPCGNTYFGEVEDYSIIVKGWIDVSPLEDMVASGDTSIILINLNAIDLESGNFGTNLIINSNDPMSEIVQVPISLRVDHLIVDATTNYDTVCAGTLVVLQADVSGIFDSISYLWSSKPAGFSSEKARPFAVAQVPTWYIVEIHDNGHVAIDSVFISVLPSPIINLGADTSLCGNETVVLNAGTDGITYLWSTGDTVNYLTVDTLGYGYGIQNYWVDVTNNLDCNKIEYIDIEFVNCTGIYSNFDSHFCIYPNPSKGDFYLESKTNLKELFTLKIFNSFGSQVHEIDIISFEENIKVVIDISNVDTGYYTLLLISKEKEYLKKLIITK